MGEQDYIELVKKVIETGEERGDRTGTGTKSVFGAMVRYDLSDGKIPLFTTKKMAWRSIVEELLWFIRGDTNSKTLNEKKVRIWNANGTREFLDSRGLTDREEGDLGPIYGYQWRKWNANYSDPNSTGIDQLAKVIETIKTDPNNRRMIVSSWNPEQINEMALPPCHVMFQFHVANNKLSCTMYQRSCDLGLGVPFNVASYSLLTHIIAKLTNLETGEFIHMMGDTHVYLNHIEPLQQQIERSVLPSPTLSLSELTDIDSVSSDQITLNSYEHHPPIKMKMAV